MVNPEAEQQRQILEALCVGVGVEVGKCILQVDGLADDGYGSDNYMHQPKADKNQSGEMRAELRSQALLNWMCPQVVCFYFQRRNPNPNPNPNPTPNADPNPNPNLVHTP